MSEPLVVIRLDGNVRAYQPGDTLSGQYHVEGADDDEVLAMEASVLWSSEGKGDEDLGVHEFWRQDADGAEWTDPRRPQRFSTTLPRSPLSYDGRIVKIGWCMRVRAFMRRGKEVVGQKTFRLGSVPPPKAESP